MTQLFRDMRLYGNIILLLLSATVLGIAAYWASIFLPNIRHDYTIFALIIPALTILLLLVGLQWSTPRTEAFFLFIFGVLWLAMASWTTDIIGNTQCDAFSSQTVPTKSGTLSARSWCYEMRVVQAFSWMIFCLYAICLYILVSLTTRAKALGRPYAWAEPIIELPWFGQWPGWPEGQYPPQTGMYPPQNGMYQLPYAYPAGQPMAYAASAQPQMAPGYVIQQNPGHSVVIQPGVGGQPPTITQIPGSVSSV